MNFFKKMFSNFEKLSKERKIENLVVFLIILVVTLIVLNQILDTTEDTESDFENETGVELASTGYEEKSEITLETKLENILSKLDGVGNVSVMITYSESSTTVPIYNTNLSTSTIEENDTSGGTRTTETSSSTQEVVKDDGENIVTEKTQSPQVEGAIIVAEGAKNSSVKANIISAVEAVTGVATHKIQVFEMNENN